MASSSPASGSNEASEPTQHWVFGASAGDAASFGELYQRVAPAIHAWASLRIPPSARGLLGSEDVVQEVWVRALARFDTYQTSKGTFRQWIFGFAQNVLLTALKGIRQRRTSGAQAHTDFHFSVVPAEVTAISQKLSRDERLQQFLAVVRTLGPEDQELVFLRGLEGLPHEQVASELNITPAAARKRWERVRRLLEDHVGMEGLLDDER